MSTDLNTISLYVNLRREKNVELPKQIVKRNRMPNDLLAVPTQ